MQQLPLLRSGAASLGLRASFTGTLRKRPLQANAPARSCGCWQVRRNHDIGRCHLLTCMNLFNLSNARTTGPMLCERC